MTTRGALGHELVANMERMTADRIGGQSIENARRNHAYIDRGQSLSALRDLTIGEDDSAIVIAAGPSLRKMNPAAQIKATNYKGAIVAADSALAYCLQHDIVPDLVVTLDPHASRIVRWFGDPELSADSISADDYFARQDMDKAFSDELRFNQEVLRLVDDHAPQIRIALSTSASKAVADRVIESGMQVFWWNPMLDDPDLPNSATRELYELNKLPCVNAGGTLGRPVGCSHAALREKPCRAHRCGLLLLCGDALPTNSVLPRGAGVGWRGKLRQLIYSHSQPIFGRRLLHGPGLYVVSREFVGNGFGRRRQDVQLHGGAFCLATALNSRPV